MKPPHANQHTNFNVCLLNSIRHQPASCTQASNNNTSTPTRSTTPITASTTCVSKNCLTYLPTDVSFSKPELATVDRGTEESVTSVATGIVKLPNRDPVGKPIIVGTLEVGQTLRADVSGISDPNGMTNATFSYEWVNFHGPVRDGEEYTLVDGDGGRCDCWLWMYYTDDAGHEERVSSDPIEVVAPPSNSPATGAPTVTGTAQVGETLRADTSGIADDDGLINVTYSHQWVRNDGTSDTDITDATDSTYTLLAVDEGKTIKVRVSFTDDAGNAESLTSTATEAVSFAFQQQQANTPATGAPSIGGTVQVGETLTAVTTGIADADGLSGATFTYQWIANDGAADTDMQDATGSRYSLVSADEGKTLKVRVSFADDEGNDETLTSAATAAVAAEEPQSQEPPAKPTGLTGTVSHDSVSITWDNPEDDTITGYQILRRNRALHEQGVFLVHVDDTGTPAPRTLTPTWNPASGTSTASKRGTLLASASAANGSTPTRRRPRPLPTPRPRERRALAALLRSARHYRRTPRASRTMTG